MNRTEWCLVALLFLACLLAVGLTANSYGVTYDEQHYLSAGARYAAWGARLLRGDLAALDREEIFAVWRLNHEHPPLPKLAAGICHALFDWALPGLASYRLAGALWFALATVAVYLFTLRLWGRGGALFGALAFATMPRVFAHAHFAALDMPVTTWFFITTALMATALRRASSWLAILAGLAFGLALLSKVNALFLPILLLPYGLIWWRRQWARLAISLFIIGPAVFFVCWPWLWVDTVAHVREYLQFHFRHAAYNVWYLGRLHQYAPWHYPFVITAVTTPPPILLLALVGARYAWPRRNIPPEASLLVLGLAVSLLPSALPTSPKYNGERLFLPAFPFLAALAGGGLATLTTWLGRLARGRTAPSPEVARMTALLSLLVACLLILPAVRATAGLHPYQLAYYNFLVGGPGGAHARGFETIYWGQVFREAPAFLNYAPEKQATVLVIPRGCVSLLTMQQRARVLDPRIQFIGDEAQALRADYVIFQAMESEYSPLCWELVKTEEPAWSFSVGGATLLRVYDRPAVTRALARMRSGRGPSA